MSMTPDEHQAPHPQQPHAQSPADAQAPTQPQPQANPQPQPEPYYSHPTTPLPDHQLPHYTHEAPQATVQGEAPQAAVQSEAPSEAQPKSRTGALIAGLAIGVLLGGIAGGGVAAIVAANSGSQPVVQGAAGTLTLSNSETATAISGVAAVATPSVVTLHVESRTSAGSGSGVIISEDGYIVTNAHVVTLDGSAEDASVVVKLSDGSLMPGEIVGTDPYADLAVVKVDGEGLPAIEFADSNDINVGDLAVAIGAPMRLASTVTSGVVSAVYRGISVGSPLIPDDRSDQQQEEEGLPWDFRFDSPENAPYEGQAQSGGTVTIPVVQTDASINPGNSGGALLNGHGELIGINVAIASPTSANGVAGSDGLGFAIPSNLVSRVTDEIIAGERPSHGLLGVTAGDSVQAVYDGISQAGGLISEVVRGGPADEAGLRVGDVITAVDGVPARDGTSVSALIRMHAGGSAVQIEYVRNGETQQTEATLDTLDW